ncbi:hypothetical protein [Amycolatopsis nalaikhensis]|uniref:Guanylate cyclase domain-containing protein n=1 Tax=Amycolatopsis nalaikhensis TaxID=715472 RepID=A0ABY8XJG0_9PSEU|nr:hypothetical protein [Amycolatopsis sp. 2-2]WIV55756.1 hypothetical protein QP939_44275 [Amycolatopsis sp. 2-2]
MGIVVDVVGYGRRSVARQREVQQRLFAVMAGIPDAVGVDPERVRVAGGLGDGMVLLFPPEIDVTRVLPRLVRAMAERVDADNRRYRDRMRIRLAAGFGLAGRGPLGHVGSSVLELSRLNDSPPARRAMIDRENADLVVVVSHLLYQLIDRCGRCADDLPPLKPVTVSVKEYYSTAWMWICEG